MCNGLEDGEYLLDAADFFVCDEYHGVVEHGFHLIGVGYHVSGAITAVKLHTFDEFERCLGSFGFFNGNNAVLADFLHGVGNPLTDTLVACGNRSDLSDGLFALYRTAHALECFDSRINGPFDTALDAHGVCACGHVSQALVYDCLSEQCRRGRTVAGNVIRLCRDFLDELSTHILKWIFELDLLCDGYAVVGD